MSDNNTEESTPKKAKANDTEEAEKVISALVECLESHDTNRKEVQEKLHEICEKWRKEIDDFEDRINNELEGKFKEDDDRLQEH